MIGLLKGAVIERRDNQITLLVGGVGHEIHCSLNALSLASGNSSELSLWTHLVVREDVLQLYGFADKKERAVFRELIRVSGVGPKVALAILSGMDVDGLVQAVNSGDSSTLTKVPGIGKKTAERLVVEMRDRLSGQELPGGGTVDETSTPRNRASEAEAALVALGYKPVEATRMLSSVAHSESLSVEDMIRTALKSRLKA